MLEMEQLDLTKWRVSIPSYIPALSSSRRGSSSTRQLGGPRVSLPSATAMLTIAPVGSSAGHLDKSDFPLSSFTTPSQGHYLVEAEREVGGKKITSRVNR